MPAHVILHDRDVEHLRQMATHVLFGQDDLVLPKGQDRLNSALECDSPLENGGVRYLIFSG